MNNNGNLGLVIPPTLISSASSILSSVIGGGASPSAPGSGSKMGYAAFISARDQKLQELKSFGAQESMDPVYGWGVELNRGFTHAQIEKDLLKDYSADFESFMKIVYYPVLQRVNPNEYQRQMQAQGGAPGNFEASGPALTRNILLLSIGGAILVGGAIWIFSGSNDDDKKKLSGLKKPSSKRRK